MLQHTNVATQRCSYSPREAAAMLGHPALHNLTSCRNEGPVQFRTSHVSFRKYACVSILVGNNSRQAPDCLYGYSSV